MIKQRKTALVFDTETTGLIKNRLMKLDKLPEVIEFYGETIDLNTGEILDSYETLIKPQRPFDDIITKITTITNEMVEDQPTFSEVADEIHRRIAHAERVIAHNLSFDMDMLEIEFERLGHTVPWPEDEGEGENRIKRKICTVEETLHIKNFRLNLSNLHEHLFGEKFEGAHRAAVDVKALSRCVIELNKQGLI